MINKNRKAIIGISMMAASSSRAFSSGNLNHRYTYTPPSWAEKTLSKAPSNGRLALGNFPTPLYRLVPNKNVNSIDSLLHKLNDLDIALYIKRDDMSGGVETGGNKIRKLEFLLADALALGYKSVVTIGGEQSNHCRATAAVSRMLGLEPHLILRTRRADRVQSGSEEFGYVGNVLVDRMVGSSIYTCTPGEYGRVGSVELVSRLCGHLAAHNEQTGPPYAIPVGGSNGLGSWGYINGVEEMLAQWDMIESKPKLDHVVFACGSGGTAAGIAIGLALARAHEQLDKISSTMVHAVGVCDSPDYFYEYVAELADDMGFQLPANMGMTETTESFVRQCMTAHQGKGLGYASSSQEELDFITSFALETGIVLDPVYSGKALYHFITNVLDQNPEQYRGSNILFWHTGGALGLFDKGDDLLPTMKRVGPVRRLDVYESGIENGVDLSKPTASA